jgi:hypothetical protein
VAGCVNEVDGVFVPVKSNAGGCYCYSSGSFSWQVVLERSGKPGTKEFVPGDWKTLP